MLLAGIVDERREAAVATRLRHRDRIRGAGLGAREHEVRSVDAGHDRRG